MFADTKPMATPNTFTFTKALSEAVVIEDGAGIPRTIVRPSMGSFLNSCYQYLHKALLNLSIP